MPTVEKHRRGVLVSTDNVIERKKLMALIARHSRGGRSWLSKGKIILPTDCLAELLDIIDPAAASWDKQMLLLADEQVKHRDAQVRARLEVAEALERPYEILSEYDLLAKLDPHQVEAVAAISAPSLRGLALFDEQGTGKTVMALCGFDRLCQLDLVDRLMVIAPKSTLGSWQNDAEMLFGSNRRKLRIVSGYPRERHKQILAAHDILVLSYETAVSEQGLLEMIVTSGMRYMLVVDESYYVKNPDAKRTLAVRAIRQNCSRAIVICGTPAPNSPHDIIQQINTADKGLTFGDRPIPQDRYEAQTVIARYLEDAIYLRRLKQGVLPELPQKHIDLISFDLQPHQRSLYERARDDLILSVRSIDDDQFARLLTSFLARRSALMQICSHPGAVDPLYCETPAKHLLLDQLLRELIERQGSKVVIWSYFRHSLNALAARYSSYGLVRIDGSVTKVQERIAAIHRFQNDPETYVFLGNAAAAGAGITLTAAHHAIYESLSNQAAHYMQSIDRVHRRGQIEEVAIHVLLGRDTIEEIEFDRIVQKERSGRDLLGDVYEEPITRGRFLVDLGATLDG